ncbi:response regulator [Massilia terrae]|uniref:Response regulator n=1 Tax=Massilia terrae TaxID=1811224 RepID=A0ABT2D401_9BURK|nr:response regulator [Massilia terrae]MCS0660978.1 response regulator [Massilia terrae]
MLKALIVDANAISRGLLNTVLSEGGHDVVAQTHTGAQGLALALKHQPQLVCVAREQAEDDGQFVEQLRAQLPKAIVFMVSGSLDAPAIQAAMARGVHGFIVKPFKADAVLRTIRNTVLAIVRKQRPQPG